MAKDTDKKPRKKISVDLTDLETAPEAPSFDSLPKKVQRNIKSLVDVSLLNKSAFDFTDALQQEEQQKKQGKNRNLSLLLDQERNDLALKSENTSESTTPKYIPPIRTEEDKKLEKGANELSILNKSNISEGNNEKSIVQGEQKYRDLKKLVDEGQVELPLYMKAAKLIDEPLGLFEGDLRRFAGADESNPIVSAFSDSYKSLISDPIDIGKKILGSDSPQFADPNYEYKGTVSNQIINTATNIGLGLAAITGASGLTRPLFNNVKNKIAANFLTEGSAFILPHLAPTVKNVMDDKMSAEDAGLDLLSTFIQGGLFSFNPYREVKQGEFPNNNLNLTKEELSKYEKLLNASRREEAGAKENAMNILDKKLKADNITLDELKFAVQKDIPLYINPMNNTIKEMIYAATVPQLAPLMFKKDYNGQEFLTDVGITAILEGLTRGAKIMRQGKLSPEDMPKNTEQNTSENQPQRDLTKLISNESISSENIKPSGITVPTDNTIAPVKSEPIQNSELQNVDKNIPEINQSDIEEKKSSTQVNIPKEYHKSILDFVDSVNDKDLYTESGSDKYGKETEPHVTVLYGLKTNDANDLKDVVKEFGDVKIGFGKTTLFENEKYDVLKVDVKSEDLNRLNKLIGKKLEYSNDYDGYEPHLTIAYLKKGEGKKYVGKTIPGLENISLDKMIFSDKERKHTELDLKTQKKSDIPLNQFGQPKTEYEIKNDERNEKLRIEQSDEAIKLIKEGKYKEAIDTYENIFSNPHQNQFWSKPFTDRTGFKFKKSDYVSSKRKVELVEELKQHFEPDTKEVVSETETKKPVEKKPRNLSKLIEGDKIPDSDFEKYNKLSGITKEEFDEVKDFNAQNWYNYQQIERVKNFGGSSVALLQSDKWKRLKPIYDDVLDANRKKLYALAKEKRDKTKRDAEDFIFNNGNEEKSPSPKKRELPEGNPKFVIHTVGVGKYTGKHYGEVVEGIHKGLKSGYSDSKEGVGLEIAKTIIEEEKRNPNKKEVIVYKTIDGKSPNEHGVYDKKEAKKLAVVKGEKKYQGNLAEINYLQLENGKWISAIDINSNVQGVGSPLTSHKQYDSEKEAINSAADEINRYLETFEKNNLSKSGKEELIRMKKWIEPYLSDAKAEAKNENINKIEKPKSFTSDLEKKAWDYLANNVDKMIDDYKKKMGNVVNGDDARELFVPAGYDRSNVGDFLSAGRRLTTIIFNKFLDDNKGTDKFPIIQFVIGGPGAGKTSSLKNIYGDKVKEFNVIFDGAMADIKALSIVVEKAKSKGYIPKLMYIYSSPEKAWSNALARMKTEGRVVQLDYFINTYKAYEKMIPQITSGENEDGSVILVDNSGEVGKAKEISLEDLRALDYTPIRENLINLVQIAYENGQITDKQLSSIFNGRTEEYTRIRGSKQESKQASSGDNKTNDKSSERTGTKEVTPPKTQIKPESNSEPKKSQYEIDRENGFRKDINGEKIQRQDELKHIQYGKEVKVQFSKKESVPGRYALISAEDLQPSHNSGTENPKFFINEAQPRDRGELKVLKAEASKKARDLDPEQLGISPNAYFGAPVINKRGEVIQGNGRAEAIKLYYKNDLKDSKGYKKYLKENSIILQNTEKIEHFNDPVLVRIIDVDDAKAIELGNLKSSDLEDVSSNTDKSKAAINKLSPAQVEEISNYLSNNLSEDSTLRDNIRDSKDGLIEKLIKFGAIRADEMENLMNNDGTFKPEGIQRVYELVKGLLFKGGNTKLPAIFERLPFQIKQGIEKSIPRIFSVEGDKSLVKELQNAVVGLDKYKYFEKQNGGNFSDWINQELLVGEHPREEFSETELALIEALNGMKKQKDIVIFFDDYNKRVKGTEEDLFNPAVEGVSKEEALNKIFGNEEKSLQQSPKEPVTSPKGPESTTGEGKSDNKSTESKGSGSTKSGNSKKSSAEQERIKKEIDDLEDELFKKLGGNFKTGIDPDELRISLKLIGKYIELGLYKLKDILGEIYNKYGEKGYKKLYRSIKSGYNGYKTDAPDEIHSLMDEYDFVRKVDADELLKQIKQELKNVSGTTGNLESDSSENKAIDTMGKEDVQSDGREKKSGVGDGSKGNGNKESEQQRDSELSNSSSTDDGEQGYYGLFNPNSTTGTEGSFTGSSKSNGSNKTNETGEQSEGSGSSRIGRTPESEVRNDATHDKLETLQQNTKDVPVVVGDIDNIRKTLPYLLPGQQEDVQKAEIRFFGKEHLTADNQFGRGILFTNGTGTGKTFTGLGIAKRFELRGKKEILIVTPSDSISKKWISDGENLNLKITQLESTTDAGKNVTVTTFANFRENEALLSRTFDLVIYDESHSLISNEQGSSTSSDLQHKKITFGSYYARERAEENINYKTRLHEITEKYNDDLYNRLTEEGKKKQDELKEELKTETEKVLQQTKVLFLSATPFAYHKNLKYADGYLFSMGGGDRGGAYNSGSSEDHFYMSNFGYRMRYNKLTMPEAGVDVSLMERNFAEELMRKGVMSARKLDVPFDYSRDFVITDSELGRTIDEGISKLHDMNEFPNLKDLAAKKFNYLYTSQLLEAIKAKHSIERIAEHLKHNRKIIVFHGYNNALPSHPFEFSESLLSFFKNANKIRAEIREFHTKYPQYKNLDLSGLGNPIKTIKAKFPKQTVIFNGTIPKKEREKAIKNFNDDKSGVDIFVVQMDAGKEGISLHDLTGEYQRVIMNLGLPVKPTMAIQTEGRAYRIGQKSDAIFEYPVLHTNFEMEAFSRKIASRVKTPENLALGKEARNLEIAFKEGYQNADYIPVSTKQGTGGKLNDNNFQEIDEFDKAKTYYFGRAKKTSRNKSAEGIDYFATPEPLGYKMVEWVNSNPNDDLMEPSAGHGAIARFFPGDTRNVFIEPSQDLRSQLGINATGEVKDGTFEQYYVGNKFDGIVTNPPFGKAGSTAIEHLQKDFAHLRNGGRIVALVPEGAFNTKFQKIYEDEENDNMVIRANIKLPSITFERAGTNVNAQILVIDKINNPEKFDIPNAENIDLTYVKNIGEFFDAIKDIELPGRINPSINITGAKFMLDDNTMITGKIVQPKKYLDNLIAYREKLEENQKNSDVDNYWTNKQIAINLKALDARIKEMKSRIMREDEKQTDLFGSDLVHQDQQTLFSTDNNLTSPANYQAQKILVDTLKKAFPQAEVEFQNSQQMAEEIDNKLGMKLSVEDAPKGYVMPDGTIFINSDKASLETPIHEFGHIWAAWAKDNAPELYKKGLELISQDSLLTSEINKKYKDIYGTENKELLLEEALVTAIGWNGEYIFEDMKDAEERKTFSDRFKTFIKKLFEKIKNLFRTKTNKFEVDKLTPDANLQEFLDAVGKDLLGGKKIGDFKTSNNVKTQYSFADNTMMADVIDGFYSPIEKRIAEFKQEKVSANKWKDIVGKGDEAVYTGVMDWLNSKKPDERVTRQEIMNFMKNNRIEIKEVVRGNSPALEKLYWDVDPETDGGETYYITNPENDVDIMIHYDQENEQYWVVEDGNTYEDSHMTLENAKDWVEEHLNNLRADTNIEATKYHNYQTPGEKENYKEVLITLPEKEKAATWTEIPAERRFTSTHFDEPNIIAHLRMNTRTDTEGKKVLFLEELQSDWGQQGKRKGFAPLESRLKIPDLQKQEKMIGRELEDVRLDKIKLDRNFEENGIDNDKYTKDEEELSKKENDLLNDYHNVVEELQTLTRNVSLAPYVTDTNSWVKLALKYAVRHGIQEGADNIAWTTGEQQNERYDLSKFISKINYNSKQEYLKAYDLSGKEVISKIAKPEELESIIGKDIAKKLIEQTDKKEYDLKVANRPASLAPNKDRWTVSFVKDDGNLGQIYKLAKSKKEAEQLLKDAKDDWNTKELSGLELQIGGKGMKGFYGSPSSGELGIIGKVAESLFGKNSVKTTDIDIKRDFRTPSEIAESGSLEEGETIGGIIKVNSVSITPELRNEVKNGLPKFLLDDKGNDFTKIEKFEIKETADERFYIKTFDIDGNAKNLRVDGKTIMFNSKDDAAVHLNFLGAEEQGDYFIRKRPFTFTKKTSGKKTETVTDPVLQNVIKSKETKKFTEILKEAFSPELGFYRGTKKFFDQTSPVSRIHGKEMTTEILKNVFLPEAMILKLGEEQSRTIDKSFDEIEQQFAKFTDEDLNNFNYTRGEPVTEKGAELQAEAIKKLPKEFTGSNIYSAIREASDYIYNYAKDNNVELRYFREYFYGNYKNKKIEVEKVMREINTSTSRFIKQKKIPTIADAAAYGLELKAKNPITNLKQEMRHVAQMVGLKNIKEHLLSIGDDVIQPIGDKNPDVVKGWKVLKDPILEDYYIEPVIADLLRNLISANKVTQIPLSRFLRNVGHALQIVKFFGSVFHFTNGLRHSIVMETGGMFNPKGYIHFGKSLKKINTKEPEYHKYVGLGGEHKYSIESEAHDLLKKSLNALSRNKYIGPIAKYMPFLGTHNYNKWVPASPKFIEWMFDSQIPSLKYLKWKLDVERWEKKNGKPIPDHVAQSFIKRNQNYFGEMNERLLGRSGTTTSFLRLIFSAPGYGEGNFKTVADALSGDKKSIAVIINSLILTSVLASVLTKILTGEWPDAPKTLKDIRDVFKADTGVKDKNGDAVKIDLMTYDKDYWSLFGNALTGQWSKIGEESWQRGTYATSPLMKIWGDLSTVFTGGQIYDFKGKPIYYSTDNVGEKLGKFLLHEAGNLKPISASVTQQAIEKGEGWITGLVQGIIGFRTTNSEKVKEEKKIISDLYTIQKSKIDFLASIRNLDPKEQLEKAKEFNDDATKKIQNILSGHDDLPEGTKGTVDKNLLVDLVKLKSNKDVEKEGTNLENLFSKDSKAKNESLELKVLHKNLKRLEDKLDKTEGKERTAIETQIGKLKSDFEVLYSGEDNQEVKNRVMKSFDFKNELRTAKASITRNLNDGDDKGAIEYIEYLRELSKNKNVDKDVRIEIQDFFKDDFKDYLQEKLEKITEDLTDKKITKLTAESRKKAIREIYKKYKSK